MIRDAINFISNATVDKQLRFLCYKGSEEANLLELLSLAGYTFTLSEFDDAIVQHLFICKDEDEADNIKQFQLWFKQL
jgi:hypothetical protein